MCVLYDDNTTKGIDVYTYVYTYVYMYVYIYIHIYREREREIHMYMSHAMMCSRGLLLGAAALHAHRVLHVCNNMYHHVIHYDMILHHVSEQLM